MEKREVAVFRWGHFNAAHRLAYKNLSDEENFKIFGPCSYPHFHGHNYELIVKVVGIPDPVSGFVINIDELKKIIKEEVSDRFDHKNLNEDVDFFKEKLPSAENIAMVIFSLLRKKIPAHLKLQVRLYETTRNFVEFPVEPAL